MHLSIALQQVSPCPSMILDIHHKTGRNEVLPKLSPASSPMPCFVVEPPCVSSPRGGLPNRLAHVVSSLIASFASPGLTHILHLRGWRQSGAITAHCVFYAPRGVNLSTAQVGIRVDSCHSPSTSASAHEVGHPQTYPMPHT